MPGPNTPQGAPGSSLLAPQGPQFISYTPVIAVTPTGFSAGVLRRRQAGNQERARPLRTQKPTGYPVYKLAAEPEAEAEDLAQQAAEPEAGLLRAVKSSRTVPP